MFDEIFDLFERKKSRGRGQATGLRGMIDRAFAGDDDDRRSHRDRDDEHDDRRYRDDADHPRGSRGRRDRDAFDFD